MSQTPPPADTPSGLDLRARILDAARATPAPSRRQVRLGTVVTLAIGVTAMVTVFVLIGGVRVDGRPLGLVFFTATGALVIAALAFWLAFGRGGSMLGRDARLLIWMTLAVPLLLFAWKLGASASCDLDEWWPSRPGLRCLLWTMLMGMSLMAAVLYARRPSVPDRPGVVGVAFGASVGACAWVLTDLWCPVAHPAHLLIGHVLPLVLLGTIGGLVGRKVLPPRR
ncbi:MAG: NrsF family protein [Myxococcota bacterium]